MRRLMQVGLSLLFGVFLLWPLSAVYGALNMPVYHAWGVMHGAFATAIPALVAASYAAIGMVPWFGAQIDNARRVVASLSVLALVTVLYWANQESQFRFSVWHGVIFICVCMVFLVLCVRARKPQRVPLFFLAPLLVDPLFNLVITVGWSGWAAVELFFYDLRATFLPAALASSLAVVLARTIDRRVALGRTST